LDPTPVTEGRLISVSRRGAGSGGRDMTLHRRCGAGARRSKPRLFWRAVRTPGAVTAGRRTVLPSQECRRVPGPRNGGSHAAGFALTWQVRPPGRVRSKPKTPRAGRPGFGGLAARFAFSLEPGRKASTQDFDKPRCREASRPAGPIGPLASRAPSVGGWRQESKEDGPARGLDKEYGRWCLGLRDCLASSLEGRQQARTGNTCDCLATVLEHLSHTLQ
jgi:hypothetical protein